MNLFKTTLSFGARKGGSLVLPAKDSTKTHIETSLDARHNPMMLYSLDSQFRRAFSPPPKQLEKQTDASGA